MTLFQPIIWLLLFGALFKSVARLPGFHGSYINFLTPGVVVMLAVFSAGWTGMGFVEDINSGVMGDIRQATGVARKMITEWGMNERLGFVFYGEDENRVNYFDFGGGREYSEENAKTERVPDGELCAKGHAMF